MEPFVLQADGAVDVAADAEPAVDVPADAPPAPDAPVGSDAPGCGVRGGLCCRVPGALRCMVGLLCTGTRCE
ncbi:MAG: hypothetical protein U0324_35820 [Polyangiales bacterium]